MARVAQQADATRASDVARIPDGEKSTRTRVAGKAGATARAGRHLRGSQFISPF
jgi:hypothetical protein